MKTSKLRAMSLVSILIGLALGALVLTALLQIFSSTQANYKLTQNLAEMNDVLRYASVTMTKIIEQAGYRTPNATTGLFPDYATAFPSMGPLWSGVNGSYNTTLPNSDEPNGVVLSYFPGEDMILSEAGIDPGDKFWIKFYGDPNGTIRDCNDLYGDANAQIRIMFYSNTITVNGLEQTGYYCDRNDNGDSYFYEPSSPYGNTSAMFVTSYGAELIPPALFDRAWVRFGEDIANKGYIDRWTLGEDVADRNRVYAVRVAFLIHSRDDVRNADVTQNFYIFGETVTRTSKKLYQLYVFTVRLPNAPNYSLAAPTTPP